MKAFLLAAGLGTRLKPLTNSIPKCLVKIGERPLLDYWLEQLFDIGCTEVLINTHYLSEVVKDFVDSTKYKHKIKLVHEPILLGSIGSLKESCNLLDTDEVLVAHADNFCIANWNRFLQIHRTRSPECHMSMMLFRTHSPEQCGMVEVDDNGVVSGYIEKPKSYDGYGLANAAIFIFSQSTLQKIISLPPNNTDLCRDFIPTQVGHIATYFNEKVLVDVGTVESYRHANSIAKSRFSIL